MVDDPWLGTWVLDPSTLDYQLGRPGRRATYVIEAAEGGGYTFILDGEDADENPIEATYGGPLDGVDREIPGGFMLGLARLGTHSIESTLKRDGQVLDRWVRDLATDGATIRFTQFRLGPDGHEYRNSSVYRRSA